MGTSSFFVHRFVDIDSTNTWLLAAARGGAPDRTVAVADHQQHGRGRLERRWEAPPGSALLCSVLLRARLPVAARHLAGVAVSLSALDALKDVAGCGARLKWPNDLVVGDRKLGGVLAETDGASDGTEVAIVVGLGLNLSTTGPSGAHGTSVLAETGSLVERDALLAAYLDHLDARADALGDPAGRAALLQRYREHLVTIGRHVVVSLHDGAVEGVATSVDEHGHLLVGTASGERSVAVGDVVHVRPANLGIDDPSE